MKIIDRRDSQPLHPARFTVGESLVWSAAENSVFFVDIIERHIHAYRLDDGRLDSWSTPEWATSIGLRRDGGFIIGLEHRVCLWRPGSAFETFAVPEPEQAGNRLNEGAVAPDGSFWVGTMQNNLNPDGSPRAQSAACGALYRIAPDGTVTQLSPAIYGIINTMVWLPDGRFVTADSVSNQIFAYDQVPDGLGRRRTLLANFQRGAPDGSTLDADGHIWNCRVAGGRSLARIGPNGEVNALVELPCSWPTSCCFGGRDLDQLFVSSARFTMDEKHLDAQPQEGGLFALDVGQKGHAPHEFG